MGGKDSWELEVSEPRKTPTPKLLESPPKVEVWLHLHVALEGRPRTLQVAANAVHAPPPKKMGRCDHARIGAFAWHAWAQDQSHAV